MKTKLIYLVITLFVFVGCKKDEEPKKTTYQIVNNMAKETTTIEYLDGTLWEVIVFCYAGNDIARQDNLSPVQTDGGKSELKEVPDNITKIKASFKFIPQESDYYELDANIRQYVVAYCFLEKGKNNQLIIDAETLVSGSIDNKSANSTLEFRKALKTNLMY